MYPKILYHFSQHDLDIDQLSTKPNEHTVHWAYKAHLLIPINSHFESFYKTFLSLLSHVHEFQPQRLLVWMKVISEL